MYLLAVSLLLHLGVAALVIYWPPPPPPPREPVFMDLQQMPDIKVAPKPQQQVTPQLSDRQRRVERETAPRGRDSHDSSAGVQPREQQRETSRPAAGTTVSPVRPAAPLPTDRRMAQTPAGSSVAGLLKPRQPSQEQLFPGSNKMAKLEDSYRRKFESDIAEGDTKFLNTEDIQFGSFLRRFENGVYGVWRYPEEAAKRGIEGVTPVKVTFNRKGEIVQVQLLESSGSRILDEEVLRTLKMIGPVGSFPKGYDKDEFHLIAFFQYGGARRSLR